MRQAGSLAYILQEFLDGIFVALRFSFDLFVHEV